MAGLKYYQYHIGDRSVMTRLMTFAQKGILSDMIDTYLSCGKPIGTHWVANMKRVAGEEDVDIVLSMCFVLDGDVYRNEWCDQTIADYEAMAEKNRRNAMKRSQKSQQEPSGNRVESDSQPSGNPVDTLTNKPINQGTNIEVLPDGSTCGNSCADAPELPPEQEAEPQLNGVEKPLKQQNCPTKEIVDSYNEILGPWLGRVREVTPSRRTAIRARWLDVIRVCGVSDRETSIVATRAYFEKIARSNFLMGRVEGAGRKWKADFDWILKSDSFTKIYEGKYDNQR